MTNLRRFALVSLCVTTLATLNNFTRTLHANPKTGIEEQPKQPLLGVMQVPARQGVLIKQIIKGSSAERAGLQPGDIIISVDGVQIRSPRHLYDVIQQYKPGQEIELGYVSNGRFSKINIVLGEYKSD